MLYILDRLSESKECAKINGRFWDVVWMFRNLCIIKSATNENESEMLLLLALEIFFF